MALRERLGLPPARTDNIPASARARITGTIGDVVEVQVDDRPVWLRRSLERPHGLASDRTGRIYHR